MESNWTQGRNKIRLKAPDSLRNSINISQAVIQRKIDQRYVDSSGTTIESANEATRPPIDGIFIKAEQVKPKRLIKCVKNLMAQPKSKTNSLGKKKLST